MKEVILVGLLRGLWVGGFEVGDLGRLWWRVLIYCGVDRGGLKLAFGCAS